MKKHIFNSQFLAANVAALVMFMGSPMIAHELTKFISYLFNIEYNQFIWYILWLLFWGCCLYGMEPKKYNNE